MVIEIDFSKINDWNAFHSVFAEAMGFPDFYGNNNNAWIDCMSYIDDEDAGMSKVTVKPGESLDIIIDGTEKAIESTPEVFLGFIDIVAAVNQRFIESNTNTRLKVIATSHLKTQCKKQPCSDAAKSAAPFNSNVIAPRRSLAHLAG